MPSHYNTRRKSLSLPSLGIHVPVTNAARAAAANRASSNNNNTSSHSNSNSSSRHHSPATMASPAPSTASMSSNSRDNAPPSKKLKRVHTQDSEDRAQPRHKKRDSTAKMHNTPPPSPGAEQQSIEMDDAPMSKPIDLKAIGDEIVEAVIVQLQNNGNKPQLVKNLVPILMRQLKIVQQSANANAIISSRLTTYMKRSGWTSQNPCPLGKELESTHPRRTYFFLTTCPHQPIPDSAEQAQEAMHHASRTIISPSLSGAESGTSEDADAMDRRRELSPSPEVDLSSPELDDIDDDIAMPNTPVGSFTGHGFFGMGGMRMSHLHTHHHHHHHQGSSAAGRNHRATSPPLEKDEKEFTQTADGLLQKRKLGGDLLSGRPSASAPSMSSLLTSPGPAPPAMDMDLFEATKDEASGPQSWDRMFLNVMSQQQQQQLASDSAVANASSPAIRPATLASTVSFGSTTSKKDATIVEMDAWRRSDAMMMEWGRSPENIGLDELDCLLDDF